MTGPFPTEQVPGVQHRRFGDVLVTALDDGWVRLTPETYLGCDAAEVARLSALAFGPPLPRIAINVLLVRTAGRTVLVDAGGGALMGSPDTDRLGPNLRAAGVAPEDVDTLLLTHMHRDHLGGAITADGAPAFPRAELVYPAKEAAFWLDPARMGAAADSEKPRYALARQVVDAYAGRHRALEDGGLPSGIEARPMPGHTPGHTGFLLGTGPDRLLYWADLVHVPAVQVPRPEIGVRFDIDPVEAVATRRAVLDMAAAERILVNGGHMDFPGFAHVERAATGFRLVWSAWAPTL